MLVSKGELFGEVEARLRYRCFLYDSVQPFGNELVTKTFPPL
jgi:hypothetical protein